MLAIGLSAAKPAKYDPVLLIILGLAMAIATIGPFDMAVHAVSHGRPALRVLLIGALTLVGAACARGAGLSLKGRDAAWPWVATASALGVAIYVCLVDALLFRRSLPLWYLQEMHSQSLGHRLSYYFLRAFQENVIYRAFVFSVLMLLVCRVRGVKAGELPPIAVWLAAFATQFVNVSVNTIALDPSSPGLLAYEVVRYVVPGAFWGWLYWRFGFASIEVGHVGCHAFLQPALTVLL